MINRLILAALAVHCSLLGFAQSITVYSPDYSAPVWAFAMSSNARYLACYLDGSSAVLDRDTETYYVLEQDSEFSSISDEGVMVGWADDGAVTFDTTETITVLPNSYGNAYPTAITADGSVICGRAIKTLKRKGCVWQDGEQSFLPDPSYSFENDGSQAWFICDDASVIVGMAIDNLNTWPMVLWYLQDDGSYLCDPVCETWWRDPSDYEYDYDTDEFIYSDDNTNPYFEFLPRGISRNGKYVSLYLATTDYEDQVGRYNVETGELEVASGYYSPHHVADDGTIVGSYVYYDAVDYTYEVAFIWRPGEEPKLIADEFPDYTELAEYDAVGYNRAVDITPDGRYICGIAYAYFDEDIETYGEDCYVRDITWVLDTTGEVGIEQVVGDKRQVVTNTAYDLSGRAVNPNAKGLKIINGKKVLD